MWEFFKNLMRYRFDSDLARVSPPIERQSTRIQRKALRMNEDNDKTHYLRKTCRACEGDKLEPFLLLGDQPLANSFLKSPEEFAQEVKYPLDVYRCKECSLIQLLDVIAPEVLFRDYIYVTGTSDTIAKHNLSCMQMLWQLVLGWGRMTLSSR